MTILAEERTANINSWLEAICYRDLHQFKDYKYDSELALSLLKEIAVNSDLPVNKTNLTELGASTHSITKHLSALENLFLIYKIPSATNPRAHDMYKIFDAGVLNTLLGGQETIRSRHASLLALIINEIYAQYEYAGKIKPSLSYYKSRGGAEIDLVLKTDKKVIGIKGTTNIEISPYNLRGMKSFLHEHEKAIGYIIAPVQEAYAADKNIFVIPWNAIG